MENIVPSRRAAATVADSAGPPRAIFVDIGGVLLRPMPSRVRRVLAAAGIPLTDELIDRASYGPPHADLGMGQDDADDVVNAAVTSYALRLGAPMPTLGTVVPDLVRVLEEDWFPRYPDETVPALRKLAAIGVPLVLVTNAEGEAGDVLAGYGLCQVGPGDGVPVTAIIDSGHVGVGKPDPAIFDFALKAIQVGPEETVHLGDSVRNDVECARAAGITPVHFDPYGGCGLTTEHAHVGSLAEFSTLVSESGWRRWCSEARESAADQPKQ